MQPTRLALTVLVLFATVAFAAPKKKPAPPPKKPAATKPASTQQLNNTSFDSGGSSASADSGGAPQMRGPARIDFDDRLIQGQTNKSGAVYLYDRKELKIRSMIKKRENFREEIVGSLYDT